MQYLQCGQCSVFHTMSEVARHRQKQCHHIWRPHTASQACQEAYPAWNPCQHPGHQDRAADIKEVWIKWFWVAAWSPMMNTIPGKTVSMGKTSSSLSFQTTKYTAAYFYILIPGSPRDPGKKWSVWHGHVKANIQQKWKYFLFSVNTSSFMMCDRFLKYIYIYYRKTVIFCSIALQNPFLFRWLENGSVAFLINPVWSC